MACVGIHLEYTYTQAPVLGDVRFHSPSNKAQYHVRNVNFISPTPKCLAWTMYRIENHISSPKNMERDIVRPIRWALISIKLPGSTVVWGLTLLVILFSILDWIEENMWEFDPGIRVVRALPIMLNIGSFKQIQIGFSCKRREKACNDWVHIHWWSQAHHQANGRPFAAVVPDLVG